jgi:hypothetical protein
MPRLTKKKYGVIAGITALLLVVGGIAYAYWTSAGTGTGTATTGTDGGWTVVVDSVDNEDLSPNGPTQTIDFHATNAGTGVQSVTGAVASVTGTSNGGCTATDFEITNTTVTTGSVNPGDTVDGSFDLQMVDTGSNQDACKGVTVNLKVDVS